LITLRELCRPVQSKIVLPYFTDYYLIIRPESGTQN
jgi:hypothetical protein